MSEAEVTSSTTSDEKSERMEEETSPVDEPTETKDHDIEIIKEESPEIAAADSSTVEESPVEEKADSEKEVACLAKFFETFKERLNPCVRKLIYWEDVQKSGPLFLSVFFILLSFALFSTVTVIAYLGLAILTASFTYRIYKTVTGALHTKEHEHPFKEALEKEVVLPTERAHEALDKALGHVNCALGRLRHLFLIENVADSVKFGIGLYVLTYVGCCFNLLTIVILAFVALFTLPKIYEVHQEKIDKFVATFVHRAVTQAKALYTQLREKVDPKLPPKVKEFVEKYCPAPAEKEKVQ